MLFSLSDFRRWFPYEMAWWNRTIFDKIFMDIYFLQLQKCTIDIIKYIYNRNSRFWFSFLKRKKKKKLYISTTIIISWIAQKHHIRRNAVLSFTNVVCIKIDTLTINSLSIYPILAGLSRAQSLTSGYTGWRDFNGKSEFTKRESCGPSPSHGIYVHAVMQLDAPLLSLFVIAINSLSGRTHFSPKDLFPDDRLRSLKHIGTLTSSN